MKVGDLVELSAYGRKRRHRRRQRHMWDMMGLVIEHKVNGFFQWKVHWLQTEASSAPGGRAGWVARKDIKHVKVKKST